MKRSKQSLAGSKAQATIRANKLREKHSEAGKKAQATMHSKSYR